MDNKKVVITKILPAPIEKVWDAWTRPEQIMQWESPENMTTPNATVDLQVGGEYSVTMEGGDVPEGMVKARGQYKVIEKPTKLVFTWQWEGEDQQTEITVQLKELSSTETEMTFIHEGFANKDSADQHTHGWTSTFTKLEKVLK